MSLFRCPCHSHNPLSLFFTSDPPFVHIIKPEEYDFHTSITGSAREVQLLKQYYKIEQKERTCGYQSHHITTPNNKNIENYQTLQIMIK